jgi:hypothetical protein
MRQPAIFSCISRKHIASEYGSWPVAAAAHQILIWRFGRAARSAGIIASRNCSNGTLSRKKNDSLVVIASTTSPMSGSAGSLSLRTNAASPERPALRATGNSRLSTKYCRPAESTSPERSLSMARRKS